jgi:hypothetical protein
MLFPFFQQPRPFSEDRVPARVQIAMRLLDQLAEKASVHQAAEMDQHDGFMNAKGQELTEDEKDAVKTSCLTLSKYLAGKLEPSDWEKADQKKNSKQRGIEAPCPFCCNRGSMNYENVVCPACGGDRQVLIMRIER